jgi:ribonucleoside-diphosphate reductase alpha chain
VRSKNLVVFSNGSAGNGASSVTMLNERGAEDSLAASASFFGNGHAADHANGSAGPVLSMTHQSSSAAASTTVTTALMTSTAIFQATDERLDRIREAKLKGYEGDACGECGNFTLVRNGTCMKCATCGATSGCS